mgnify:CR=1 FL=1|tara:strand:- start:6086 stop:6640 length:555 start_codon:yes stop_codon:yes gene_type:complete
MDNNIQKGQLKRWNDDKGFGFIKPDNDSSNIFLHISALAGMSRRPIMGDTIFYNILVDTDGKKRAFNARIDGVTQIQDRPVSPRRIDKESNNSNGFTKLLIFIVLLVMAFYLFDKRTEPQITPIKIYPVSASKRALPSPYTCSGKTYCSEMSSCEEATFYQTNCPGTKIDGDGDGIPCESQWCN